MVTIVRRTFPYFSIPPIFLLLCGFCLVLPSGIYAQVGVSNTASSPITASTAMTIPVTTAMPSASPQQVAESDIYGNMLGHFRSVTEISFGLVTAVVGVLGVIGVIAAYFSFKTVKELESSARRAEAELRELKGKIQKFQEEAESDLRERQQELVQMRERFDDALDISSRTQKRLWLSIEVKDPSPIVRMRAVQQFSEIDDIISISILIEVLNSDNNSVVQMEAAVGLGKRLRDGGAQGEMYQQGLSALYDELRNANTDVQQTVLEAFEAILKRGCLLPQYIIVALRKLANDDNVPEVAAVAQRVLSVRTNLV